jgi:hypothetical protein
VDTTSGTQNATSTPVVPGQTHSEHEDHGWTIKVADHPQRADSPEYVAARKMMNQVAVEATLLATPAPYQDHHGGSLWLKDEQGWFIVRNQAGIEWSAQFCADPAKVDRLRINAKRLYARFPEAVAELGIADLLNTPITDAAGVARWTDSICNAGVPLPANEHTGVLPAGAGVHHYPTPVTDIDLIKYDDFQLWVTDDQGQPAAVTPVAPRGSGESCVHVEYATPGSHLDAKKHEAEAGGRALVLPGESSLAQKAFARQ